MQISHFMMTIWDRMVFSIAGSVIQGSSIRYTVLFTSRRSSFMSCVSVKRNTGRKRKQNEPFGKSRIRSEE